VAEGTPEQVAKTAGSYTGEVLKPVLAKAKAKGLK
jgi:excinuclease UvrABC ATPase subunit